MKTYVILDKHDRVIRTELAETAHAALEQCQIGYGKKNAKVAMAKDDWEKTQKQTQWLQKARVGE